MQNRGFSSGTERAQKLRRPFTVLKQIALSVVVACAMCAVPARADAPPIRIAVIPAGGSGIEQDAVDRIAQQLEGTEHVVISTVNPDWYVVCNIQERTDQMSGAIRYNGTVTVKTTDGQVISNVAVQKYNQDFSLTPGAQLNKALVDGAARDVISGMADRALGPIQQAVQTEMDTRNRVGAAMQLANSDKFDEAMAALGPVTPDSTHFKQVQMMMGQFQMEKKALELVNSAEAQAKKGKFMEAIRLLKDVDKHSRRNKVAQQKIGSYRAAMSRQNAPKLAKNKPPQTAPTTKGTGDQVYVATPESEAQSLDRAKKALQMQEQAIEAKESALQMQHAIDGQQPSNKKTK